MSAGSAAAQTAAPAAADNKRCEANNAGANGNASEADMNSTYSACRLANGAVGMGWRTNDGKGALPEFSDDESSQVLRKPQFDSRGHDLSQFGTDAGTRAKGLGRGARQDGFDYSAGTRDFVAQERLEPFSGGEGYRAVGRALPEQYAPLLTSSDTPPPAAASGGGVGSGGAGGGIEGRSIAPTAILPPVLAVPEPETYAMLLAGLAMVAFAGRRKRIAKA
ncbi:PEP-CTERM sorting domain-containing protein [Janthinobacterium sp. GW458P]|uniref:PEP-CTERM sorting domain-containing protein n=1 Tax=Janthinobacterium sp. GW458P TaxID=1981504 RepID=UPI001D02D0B0|nr:PEP-CTERM sorting domain-containing protein [Janthinobacterium sp. GW458P]